MRIFYFLMICTCLAMCKSNKVLPTEESITYVVILEDNSTPKNLMSMIKHTIVDSEQYQDNDGQWLLMFKNEGEKSSRIKADLLNKDIVFGVYSIQQMDDINAKTPKKGKQRIKSKTNSKQ